MAPEIATPSVCPNAPEKLYVALAKGKSAVEAEAWVPKPSA
jgi:hypothetical protein